MSKNNITRCLFAATMAFLILFNTACDKDEEVGVPSIEYIRYTSSEDPVTYANLGQTIAIIGENLQTVKQITFNGYPGVFKTTMVTNNSIVVVVSTDTPFEGEEASNEVVVSTDGGDATSVLEIAPPAPEITTTSPQYAGEGAIVTIKGDYFYNITSVMFGDDQAQILEVDPYYITVKVPEGYSKDHIYVTSSKSGASKSDFMFGLDDGVIELNWGDIYPTQGAWWNSSIDGPEEEFDLVGGPYKYVEATFGNTWWTLDGGIQFDANEHRQGNPAIKELKFEYALIGDSPWIQLLWKSSLGEYKFIVKDLKPTGGKWDTYSVTMNHFTLGDDGPQMTQEVFESDDPLLLQYAFVNSGDAEITIKCSTTNFRFEDK
ncbi:IPT/TIG domain-containing protein [Labilibacter marinus]|uniref:IPT/TIG domain-containing protein n=1 Tax=Labilibacter marinus TaxID=1477105 RepID=UPI00082BF848|nr:IPT/TIG domain-containing protein [Labilibacter marinus]